MTCSLIQPMIISYSKDTVEPRWHMCFSFFSVTMIDLSWTVYTSWYPYRPENFHSWSGWLRLGVPRDQSMFPNHQSLQGPASVPASLPESLVLGQRPSSTNLSIASFCWYAFLVWAEVSFRCHTVSLVWPLASVTIILSKRKENVLVYKGPLMMKADSS